MPTRLAHTRPRLGHLLVPFIALMVLVESSGPATAVETFDIAIHVYCRPPEISGTFCGEPDLATLKSRMIQNVQEMNLRFCEAGFTFRPLTPSIVFDLEYSIISAANGAVEPDPLTYGGLKVKELRDNVAAVAPTIEHVFIAEGLGGVGFASMPPY